MTGAARHIEPALSGSGQQGVDQDGGWGWQRVVFLLIILLSIGIRALPMQGIMFALLICLTLATRVAIPMRQMLSFMALSAGFTGLALRGMSEYSGVFYLSLSLLAAFLFHCYVGRRWARLETDLLQITWALSLHGLVSYLVHLVAPGLFQSVTLGVMKYHYFGIFVLTGTEPFRATGLCWEPGLLQYVANISLFLGLKRSWPRWKLLASFLAIVATYSTTGIFALTPTILYLLFSKRRSLRQWLALTAVLLCLSALGASVFYQNITDKLGGANTSGLIRLRDFRVGLQLIQDKPLMGHGQFDIGYLTSQSSILDIESDVLSQEYLSQSAEMSGGYTNGLLLILAGYGLLLGSFLYWCFLNNQVIQGGGAERLTFFLISMATFVSEPITYTPWFFVLVMSGVCSPRVQARLKAVHRTLLPRRKGSEVTN